MSAHKRCVLKYANIYIYIYTISIDTRDILRRKKVKKKVELNGYVQNSKANNTDVLERHFNNIIIMNLFIINYYQNSKLIKKCTMTAIIIVVVVVIIIL